MKKKSACLHQVRLNQQKHVITDQKCVPKFLPQDFSNQQSVDLSKFIYTNIRFEPLPYRFTALEFPSVQGQILSNTVKYTFPK